MLNEKQILLDKSRLQHACKDLTIEEILKARQALFELIEEKKNDQEQRLLKRKGDRALDDMRRLMAKAGISMSEFQQALGD